MLQRLPGLGRTEVESDDRKFIDVYIVDGLRALDASRSVSQSDYRVTKERWANPLGQLGQRILAREIENGPSSQPYRNFVEHGLHDGNGILASDIVASMLRTTAEEINFGGLTLTEGHITELDLSATEPKSLTIMQSILEWKIFPNHPITEIKVEKCVVGEVFGVSNATGLPDGFKRPQ